MRFVNQMFARVYHRLEVCSASTIPRAGAGILVCNHISSLDPMLIQASTNRLITWMMAREYLELPGLGLFFKMIGIIPVQRGGRDLSSTRAAMRALHEGRILGIFPEGRISTTNDLLTFQTGAAMLAIKTGVPIYPAYIDGTQRNKEMLAACVVRNQARIAFGAPIILGRCQTDRATLEAATMEIKQSVAILRNRCRRHGGFLDRPIGVEKLQPRE